MSVTVSKISENYATMVFNDHVMKERLPTNVYASLEKTLKGEEKLNLEVANAVAHVMKEWAIEKGATHFAHWFQPLSGITSEKHDSFLEPTADGRAITKFSGKELIQGEPDASSFPSGGLRATFEARGYTTWDPTSYAFVKDGVLCIPTAFCSYTGEALDKRTPLLRSMEALNHEANRVLALFGEPYQRVVSTLGAEQEYFLISEKDYEKRQDLMVTGRTLFGCAPYKGQELEEHYFGAIRPTVSKYMKALNEELWALGVAAKTEHNEVAPAQHELAPVFTNTNRAIDENLLTMEKMRLIASRYGLTCLQHEKPFEGINGSGKHNNWSMSTPTANLLDPGDTPMDNLRFLVFLSGVIQAVDDYQELLRMTCASASNDHRLGAHEAPPAIVSIFLGDELGEIVEALANGSEYNSAEKVALDLGVAQLPRILKDNTDRNRTSPFAFTCNKFEFRMPGSSCNLSDCNIILNAAMAKSMKEFADAMEDVSSDEFEMRAIEYIRNTISKHQRIIFNGNGYSDEWELEAQRRGLANNRTTAQALPCFIDKKSIDLFESFGILTESEVHSRYEVKLEKYCKLLNIEARVMKRMVRRVYLPAINQYASVLAGEIASIRQVLPQGDLELQEDLLSRLVAGARKAADIREKLDDLHHEVEEIEDLQLKANRYADEVVPLMDQLRDAIDCMEIITAHDYWPVPTYNEILFYN